MDNAFGIAGAVVALTLGASIVDLKWVDEDDDRLMVEVEVFVVELVNIFDIFLDSEFVVDSLSNRLTFVATVRPLMTGDRVIAG